MSASETHPLALVTGASRGIGRELAREFIEYGFDVIVTAEDASIHEAAAELRAIDGVTVEESPTTASRR
jgi:uncharacterized protein